MRRHRDDDPLDPFDPLDPALKRVLGRSRIPGPTRLEMERVRERLVREVQLTEPAPAKRSWRGLDPFRIRGAFRIRSAVASIGSMAAAHRAMAAAVMLVVLLGGSAAAEASGIAPAVREAVIPRGLPVRLAALLEDRSAPTGEDERLAGDAGLPRDAGDDGDSGGDVGAGDAGGTGDDGGAHAERAVGAEQAPGVEGGQEAGSADGAGTADRAGNEDRAPQTSMEEGRLVPQGEAGQPGSQGQAGEPGAVRQAGPPGEPGAQDGTEGSAAGLTALPRGALPQGNAAGIDDGRAIKLRGILVHAEAESLTLLVEDGEDGEEAEEVTLWLGARPAAVQAPWNGLLTDEPIKPLTLGDLARFQGRQVAVSGICQGGGVGDIEAGTCIVTSVVVRGMAGREGAGNGPAYRAAHLPADGPADGPAPGPTDVTGLDASSIDDAREDGSGGESHPHGTAPSEDADPGHGAGDDDAHVPPGVPGPIWPVSTE